MPISELEKKTDGLTFFIAGEEMRRLKSEPTSEEKLRLYGLYKQGIHGDMLSIQDYPIPENEWDCQKWATWKSLEGTSKYEAQERYVKFAKKMIEKYGRKIVRNEWNSEIWSVDY